MEKLKRYEKDGHVLETREQNDVVQLFLDGKALKAFSGAWRYRASAEMYDAEKKKLMEV